MKFRIAMVTGLVLAWMCGASAQQRIDLDRFAEELPKLVSIRTTFEESTAACPEHNTLLTISSGLLVQHRQSPQQGPTSWRIEHTAIDDETYRNQYGTKECRFDLLIRMQVLRDGSWVSLLVPRVSRPSLSLAERKKCA